MGFRDTLFLMSILLLLPAEVSLTLALFSSLLLCPPLLLTSCLALWPPGTCSTTLSPLSLSPAMTCLLPSVPLRALRITETERGYSPAWEKLRDRQTCKGKGFAFPWQRLLVTGPSFSLTDSLFSSSPFNWGSSNLLCSAGFASCSLLHGCMLMIDIALLDCKS